MITPSTRVGDVLSDIHRNLEALLRNREPSDPCCCCWEGNDHQQLIFGFPEYPEATSQTATATISSLPNEILAAIFEVAHECGASPLAISHVSMHWRDVALNLPSLWVKITVSPTQSQAALQACLDRSKTLPLDVHFKFPEDMHPDHDFDQARNLVLPHITRWRRLVVEFNKSVLNRPNDSLLDWLEHCAVPLLEDFTLIGSESYFPHLRVFAGGAPVLSSMHLQRISFRNFSLPVNVLTTLYYHGFQYGYHRLRQILMAPPQLVRLSVHGMVTEPTHFPPISLPSLRSLRFRYTASDVNGIAFINFLPAISAPLLETLWLVDPTNADVRPFLESLQPASCPPVFPKLRSLVVQNAKFSQDTYDKMFERLPTISHFTILQERTLDIWELLCQSSVALPWPDLHTVTLAIPWLDFIITGPVDSDEALLCDMLSARMAAGRPISKLRIDRCSLRSSRLERLPRLVAIEPVDPPALWPAWWDYINTVT